MSAWQQRILIFGRLKFSDDAQSLSSHSSNFERNIQRYDSIQTPSRSTQLMRALMEFDEDSLNENLYMINTLRIQPPPLHIDNLQLRITRPVNSSNHRPLIRVLQQRYPITQSRSFALKPSFMTKLKARTVLSLYKIRTLGSNTT